MHDHHSSLVANCIGGRNAKYYLWMLVCLFLNVWHIIIQNSYDFADRIKVQLKQGQKSDVALKIVLKAYPTVPLLLTFLVIAWVLLLVAII